MGWLHKKSYHLAKEVYKLSNKRKIFVALLSAVAVVVMLGAAVALADTVSVVVNGATLSMTTGGNQSLTPVTLNGLDQTTGGSLGTYQVADARGTGNGWNVVIAATDFAKQGDPAKTIPASGFQVTPAPAVTTVAGNAAPSSFAGVLGGGGNKILSAAIGAGMGTYQFTPAVTLDVPAETYAGTYDSTVTATVTTAP